MVLAEPHVASLENEVRGRSVFGADSVALMVGLGGEIVVAARGEAEREEGVRGGSEGRGWMAAGTEAGTRGSGSGDPRRSNCDIGELGSTLTSP